MVFNLNIVDLTTVLHHKINNIDIKYFLLFH